MAGKDTHRNSGTPGPAYQARYVDLGRSTFDTPWRRGLLVLGIAAVVILVFVAVLSA